MPSLCNVSHTKHRDSKIRSLANEIVSEMKKRKMNVVGTMLDNCA